MKPFFGGESPPQFIGTIIIGNNWGKGQRETAANKVLPANGVLVGAEFNGVSGGSSERVVTSVSVIMLV